MGLWKSLPSRSREGLGEGVSVYRSIDCLDMPSPSPSHKWEGNNDPYFNVIWSPLIETLSSRRR